MVIANLLLKLTEVLTMVEEDELELAESGGSNKKLIIILIGIILLLLTGGGVGTAYVMGAFSSEETVAENAVEEEPVEEKREAIYVALDPPFTVNLQGKSKARFLQIALQTLTREPDVEQQIKQHRPVIRNNLVLLLSSKTSQDLSTREGKEKLQKEALSTVQKVLRDATGDEGVEAILFTSFVMQ